MTPSPWEAALIGQVVAGCRLEACIGVGAFGIVLEATDVKSGTRFAVKVLPPSSNADAAQEFDTEAVLLRQLNRCSSVINWVGSGSETIVVPMNGTPVPLTFKYHVMSLASGVLEELVTDPVRRDALPWVERISHWRGAIKAVHQMHLNGVAHRDLKSSNCLLMLRGGSTEVRVADLGRSKDMRLASSLPAIAYLQGRGDLRFAPPENLWWQGGNTPSDFRHADLYGLGSLLAELATGHPMTALAIGSWQNAHDEGLRNLQAGTMRDLAALRPQFRRAVDELAEEVPAVIRHETAQLLRQLCDPIPARRAPRPRPGGPSMPDDGLNWLLGRADILSRRLAVEARLPHYRSKNQNRSA